MIRLIKIEEKLRYAVENGCDYTLLEEAADAVKEANKIIEAYVLNKGEGPKTIYVQMNFFATEKDRLSMERYLNESSPDRIVVLPSCVTMINPEKLDETEITFLSGERINDYNSRKQ